MRGPGGSPKAAPSDCHLLRAAKVGKADKSANIVPRTKVRSLLKKPLASHWNQIKIQSTTGHVVPRRLLLSHLYQHQQMGFLRRVGGWNDLVVGTMHYKHRDVDRLEAFGLIGLREDFDT